MNPSPLLQSLAWGPLLEAQGLPLVFSARLCDLRPRFLPKCQVGRSHRAIARNGRLLLASDCPLKDLAGRTAQVRLQAWHKTILASDPPAPYGLLLCVRSESRPQKGLVYQARLSRPAEGVIAVPVSLTVDIGGGLVLDFFNGPGEPGA